MIVNNFVLWNFPEFGVFCVQENAALKKNTEMGFRIISILEYSKLGLV